MINDAWERMGTPFRVMVVGLMVVTVLSAFLGQYMSVIYSATVLVFTFINEGAWAMVDRYRKLLDEVFAVVEEMQSEIERRANEPSSTKPRPRKRATRRPAK